MSDTKINDTLIDNDDDDKVIALQPSISENSFNGHDKNNNYHLKSHCHFIASSSNAKLSSSHRLTNQSSAHRTLVAGQAFFHSHNVTNGFVNPISAKEADDVIRQIDWPDDQTLVSYGFVNPETKEPDVSLWCEAVKRALGVGHSHMIGPIPKQRHHHQQQQQQKIINSQNYDKDDEKNNTNGPVPYGEASLIQAKNKRVDEAKIREKEHDSRTSSKMKRMWKNGVSRVSDILVIDGHRIPDVWFVYFFIVAFLIFCVH